MTSHAKHWDAKFCDELKKESDRAVAIIAAALLEHALETLLRNHLVPCGAQDDPLFDGPYAPLSNFSSKIDLANRIGLISARWCRDLHLIRKIRNTFAHNVSGCTYDDASVRARVLELVRSQRVLETCSKLRPGFPEGPKGDLGMTVSWMLWWLWALAEDVSQLKTAPDWVPTKTDDATGTGGGGPTERVSSAVDPEQPGIPGTPY